MIKFVIPVMLLTISALPLDAHNAGDTMLNVPGAQHWNVYGSGQTHKLRKDAAVQGSGAMQIDVTRAQPNVWDIGAFTPVTGSLAKGDNVVVAFWVRGQTGGTSDVPVILQVASPPYAPIIAGDVSIGGEWKLVSITGKIGADHPAGSMNVALQLGRSARKIDLGPAFVLKLAK